MGMDIDKARRDEPIDRINLATTLASHLAHVADPIAVDRNVSQPRRSTAAVDESSAADYEIVHDSLQAQRVRGRTCCGLNYFHFA